MSRGSRLTSACAGCRRGSADDAGASWRPAMYHAIVKRQLRRVFSDLSAGNYETILGGMAPRFEHVFFGNHPLGGVRHTPRAYRAWFERLRVLFPDLGFELRNI